MRILVVTTDFLPNVSGIATLSYEQARGLSALGHDVLVLTTTAGAKEWSKTGGEGFAVTEHFTRQRAIVRVFSLFNAVKQAVKQFKPDFIWCSNYRGFGIPVMLAAKLSGIPYGMYFHGTELVTQNRNAIRRRLITSAMRGGKFLATNSQNSADIIKNRYQFIAEPITPGVHAFSPNNGSNDNIGESVRQEWLSNLRSKGKNIETFVFITLCRMSRQKGIHKILEAISQLPSESRNQILFVAAGSGEDLEDFKLLAEALSITESVIFMGPVSRDKIPSILKASDIYIQPSQPVGDFLESFGISFLEAQAAGLPCVGTDWGGVPEAVVRDVTTILIPPGSTEAVRDAMIRAINDKPWRETAAKEGPIWARQNSWERHAKSLETLITA